MSRLKTSRWKYGKVYHIGGELDFIKLRNDTIFINKSPIAVITDTQGNILNKKSAKLAIKPIETGKPGIDHQKLNSQFLKILQCPLFATRVNEICLPS